MATMISRIIKNERGLALLEVLAAMVLISLLTICIMSSFCSSANWVSKARHESAASSYAASILENLRAERSKINNSNAGQTAQELLPGCGYPWMGMTDKINRMQSRPAPYNHLYDITVTVYWREGVNMESRQLSTIIRKE
ncbi:MAG: hypothetical protein PHF24_04490 [Syntrophomonas sp.]|nr:hypothetical protein [Syntrophomonas sp.]